MNSEPKIPAPERYFEIVQVETKDELVSALQGLGADVDLLQDKGIQKNLAAVIERSKEAGKDIFVIQMESGYWIVVSSSQNEVEQVRIVIAQIGSLQKKIDPKKLSGECIYTHLYAEASGISDGNLSAGFSPRPDKNPIYQNGGIHEIGFKDVPEKNLTVYFDLTSKDYVFTPLGVTEDNAVAEGIIVIDGLEKTTALESLYQCKWDRSEFGPKTDEERKEILEEGVRFLRKE